MKRIELLAPARNLECAKAAIDHGADAVYIGAERFGARAAAGNSLGDIDELCRYAHQFGVKVYVTVNTIVYDDELDDTIALVRTLDEIGVDALLVQDMGLLDSLRKLSLRCDIHASTQTDNRTVEKVKWLADQGIKRVVLARELSIAEIGRIHKEVPGVELEVFVHGALCVSYSGQCYASQYCFGRSANRGECAQFCRLKFTLKDADNREIEHERHLLSLKDMAQIDNLEKLIEAGAVSFKIEGRLKEAEYVKNVTAAYSERLNDICAKSDGEIARASYGHCDIAFQPSIEKSFNRGFTTYFAEERDKRMASFDTPKSLGEKIGRVKEIRGRSFNVSTTAAFANGDGLCYVSRSGELVGFRVNKVEGNRIYPLNMPESLVPGTLLYRNYDQAFNTFLKKTTGSRKLKVWFAVSTTSNAVVIEAWDECGRKAEVSVRCELQKSLKPQEENIKRQLEKLGNTVFTLESVDILTDAFIPSSVLSQLRRDVTDALLQKEISREHIEHTECEHGMNYPEYALPYNYNAANRSAREFFSRNGIDDACAFETDYTSPARKEDYCLPKDSYSEKKDLDKTSIMTCRYCLKNELGFCSKSGKKAPWKEPLRLCLPDRSEFELSFDCRKCEMKVSAFVQRIKAKMMAWLCIIVMAVGLTSCYSDTKRDESSDTMHDALVQQLSQESIDSISFYSSHHYTEGYNFQVFHDSIMLIIQQPEELVNSMVVDSFAVYKNHHVVVGDIRIIPQDAVDSVWVQLATDEGRWGWIHETALLTNVVPEDPISQAIMIFSNGHIIWSLMILVLIVVAYMLRIVYKKNAPIVHFRDIPSFYPTLLTIIVASAATFYASMQMFAPETWRHYYYHPSLNPFQMPMILSIFLSSIWLMIIILFAVIDDVKNHLSFTDFVIYMLGLSGVCSLNYIIFSITTLHYIGYPLLVGYIVWAIYMYWKHAHKKYRCGCCGSSMDSKGICPNCGSNNI